MQANKEDKESTIYFYLAMLHPLQALGDLILEMGFAVAGHLRGKIILG